MNATVASYREFVLVYMQFDESDSFMSLINKQAPGVSNASAPALDANAFPMPTLGQGYGNYSIWHPQLVNMASSLKLNSTQAPTFSSLNGLIYSNNALFEVCANDPTIWYVAAYGNNPHVFHMHGNGFVLDGNNLASISTYFPFKFLVKIFPPSFTTRRSNGSCRACESPM